MYIDSLTLFNVRSFPQIKLNFSKGINILTGKNNTGKSTIIKGIYSLQNNDILTTKDIRKNALYSRIHLLFKEISKTDVYLFKDYAPTPYAPDNSLINIRLNKGGEKSMTITPIERIEAISDTGALQMASRQNPEGFSKVESLTNSEAENSFIYPFLSKRKSNYYSSKIAFKDIHIIGDDYRYIVSKVKKLSNPTNPWHDQFNVSCQKILGFRVGIVLEENDQENIGSYTSEYDPISIIQMGDGVAHIIGLIAMLLSADNKLYLIEELENDLHPEALKELLGLIIIKSKNNQFVISTHSNIVLRHLGSLNETKIFEAKSVLKGQSPTTNIAIPTSSILEIENSPEQRILLLEKLGYEPWDFELYKAYLLLEESSAEVIIREFLIPQFVSHLNNKIRTISAGGVTELQPRMHDFLRLFVFIHTNSVYFKKAWVIADGDEAGFSNIQELKGKFNSWPDSHFLNFSKKNFEDFYPERFQSQVKEISMISDKSVKRARKKQLTEDVLGWIKNNKEMAQKEFQNSAAEVISILEAIASQIT